MRRNDNACGAANLGKLLYTHSVGQRITALSAVFLRYRDTHETSFDHFVNSHSGEFFGLINLNCQRLYFLLGEISEKLSRHLMLFVQSKIHDFIFLLVSLRLS